MHWPPATDNRVLERDRDPEQRVERVDRAGPVRPGGGQAGIGGVGLGQGPRRRGPAGEAGVTRSVARARSRWAGGELARGRLARAEPGRHLVGGSVVRSVTAP